MDEGHGPLRLSLAQICLTFTHFTEDASMLAFLTVVDSQERREALTQLYNTYRTRLWFAANDILHDDSLAEDAVQNAFLALLQREESFTDLYSVQTRSFLFTVVRNKAIDLYRSRSAHAAGSLDAEDFPEPESGEDILGDLLDREARDRIVACIHALPPMQRTLLEYRYLYEMSEKQVAGFLGITPKQANIAIYRARKKLQKLLSSDYPDL